MLRFSQSQAYSYERNPPLSRAN